MSAPLLEIPAQQWIAMIDHLRCQGGGVRESGAFLLGTKTNGIRTVADFIPYEQLQADALHDDYVALTAESFSALWDVCRRKQMSVVADVHTHRFGVLQSRSDRENPMVALPGHIALIVPKFAQGRPHLEDVGMYIYRGNHEWSAFAGTSVSLLARMTEG